MTATADTSSIDSASPRTSGLGTAGYGTAGNDAAPSPDPTPRAHGSRGLLAGVGRGIGIGVLLLLGALALATVIVPRVAGAETYTITGRSMEPTLPLGSFAVVRPVPFEAVEVGDIITFQLEPGRPATATHRVVGLSFSANGERALVTQGDNNDGLVDVDPVLPAQLKGTLWYSLPFIGWVSAALTGEVRDWLVPLAVSGLFIYGAVSIARGALERRSHPAQR